MRPAHSAREISAALGVRPPCSAASMRPAHSAREIVPAALADSVADVASMRPAHSAREILLASGPSASATVASMRPAHSAREIQRDRAVVFPHDRASMRPAHSAREIYRSFGVPRAGRLRFNEARAFSAGNQFNRYMRWEPLRGFNEARAFSAGNRPTSQASRCRTTCASMRPAHSAREIRAVADMRASVCPASMRPAHSAREITPPRSRTARGGSCFNEARAFSAGNPPRPCKDHTTPELASMRPAHSAREIYGTCHYNVA